jgi:hypothetical protein
MQQHWKRQTQHRNKIHGLIGPCGTVIFTPEEMSSDISAKIRLGWFIVENSGISITLRSQPNNLGHYFYAHYYHDGFPR